MLAERAGELAAGPVQPEPDHAGLLHPSAEIEVSGGASLY